MAIRRKKKAQQQAFRLKEMQTPPDNRLMTEESDESAATEQEAKPLPIDALAIREATQRLKKYKTGKLNLEKRIVANEDYWKLRQWDYIADNDATKDKLKIDTAWLWNTIASKHADMVMGFPEANIRAKRGDDVSEAEKLKSIIPVVQKENKYEETYSDLCNEFLKSGGCVAGVFWDGHLHDGLGDIVVKDIDVLELFWETGIDNIQDSREVFKVAYVDNDVLKAKYPQLKYSLNGKGLTVTKYRTEDHIDYSNKSCVIDWYYKKIVNGKQILHLCKYVDDIVLFSSENEPEKYPKGWYHHGKYPFIVNPLFKIKGSLFGYSYTDIGRGDQNAIDIITSAIISNAVETSLPRYFSRMGGNINEQEFADHTKRIVHVQGALDDASIREIGSSPLPSFVVNVRDRLIDEMKETLGNRDVSNGGSVSGVTAASAIAAMQEQSGKLTKEHIKAMYAMHEQIVDMEIELMRQFYNTTREYRITGQMGVDKYVEYNNEGLQPKPQPSVMGIEMGLRLPCFDIEVSSAKQSPYSKLEQNELALQLYNAGVFSPQNADNALALLKFMDFDHKDEMMRVVQGNGTLLMKYQQLQKVAFQLAQALGDPVMTEQLAQAILMENGQTAEIPHTENTDMQPVTAEPAHMTRARAQAEQSTQV